MPDPINPLPPTGTTAAGTQQDRDQLARLATFARMFGVNPGMTVSGSVPGAQPSGLPALTANTPLGLNAPVPGSPGDLQSQLSRWQDASTVAGTAGPSGTGVHISVGPDGQLTALPLGGGAAPAGGPAGSTPGKVSDTFATPGGPGDAFSAFQQALQQVQGGMSTLQAGIPINTLIGQWDTSAPVYARQLKTLLQSAQGAVKEWDLLASAPEASPDWEKPIQQLGDNIDAWTLNSLTQFQQQAMQLYQQQM